MGLELDWLEREERYRRRVVRLMGIGVVVVAVVIGTLAFMRSKAESVAKISAARASEAARVAAVKAKKDAFTADSSAVANRVAGFLRTHSATPLEGTPFLQVPLPAGTAVQPFVQKLWAEYTHVVDPQVSAAQEIDLYHQYYVDVMNDGPLRPRAVLLPMLQQDGLNVTLEKDTFADITQAQVTVGMRETPKEILPDSTNVSPQEAAPTETPAPTPAPSTSTPSQPVPAEPAVEPVPTPAPKDTTPKP